jgi:hypothetical protein
MPQPAPATRSRSPPPRFPGPRRRSPGTVLPPPQVRPIPADLFRECAEEPPSRSGAESASVLVTSLASQILSFTSAIRSLMAANVPRPSHLAADLLHLRRREQAADRLPPTESTGTLARARDDQAVRTRSSASRTCVSSRPPSLAGNHPPPSAAHTAGLARPPAPETTART